MNKIGVKIICSCILLYEKNGYSGIFPGDFGQLWYFDSYSGNSVNPVTLVNRRTLLRPRIVYESIPEVRDTDNIRLV